MGFLAANFGKGLFPCMFEGVINNLLSFVTGSLGGSFHLLQVVSNLLSIWHHLSFHVSVGFLQILLERLGGVTPDASHILDLGHVDVDGQLSGLDDAQEGDEGSDDFHNDMFLI